MELQDYINKFVANLKENGIIVEVLYTVDADGNIVNITIIPIEKLD